MSSATPVSSPATGRFDQYAHLALWVVSLIAICLVPLLILGQGFLPIDDGLRHAAKAVSGRPWSDVLVLADWVKTDHNPGWHFILGTVHRITGCDVDTMLAIAVFSAFAAFAVVPLVWLRRPEVWVGTLLMGCVLSESLLFRLMLGRPLVVAMGCVVALLLVWRDETEGKGVPRSRLIQSIVILTIATWVHGAWYLFCLPIVACALSGRWRDAGWMGLSWIIGVLLGGMLTGHPIVFLVQAVEILWHALLQSQVTAHYNATEVLPSNGDKLVCVAAGVIFVWRVSRGATASEVLRNPAFILAVMGWILGLKMSRFWNEWGLPAFVCWSAIQFHASPKSLLPSVWDRGLACLFASAALVFATSSDLGFRWSRNLYASDEPDVKGDAKIAEWLPGPGGVLYNTGMSQFYRYFFRYPQGNWRYVLGFEPNLMPPENQAVYRKILKAPDAPESYQDWVRKMGANDRLMIVSPDPVPIKELEWYPIGKKTWIGRLRAVKP